MMSNAGTASEAYNRPYADARWKGWMKRPRTGDTSNKETGNYESDDNQSQSYHVIENLCANFFNSFFLSASARSALVARMCAMANKMTGTIAIAAPNSMKDQLLGMSDLRRAQ